MRSPRILALFVVLLFSREAQCSNSTEKVNDLKLEKISRSPQPELKSARENGSSAFPVASWDLELLRTLVREIDDEICRYQYETIVEGMRNLSEWAVKFYDASGKLSQGLLAGSVYQLGHFDECLDIGAANETLSNIRGRYCLSEIRVQVSEASLAASGPSSLLRSFSPDPRDRLDIPFNQFYLGICVPDACKSLQVEKIANNYLARLYDDPRLQLRVKVQDDRCYVDEPSRLSSSDIFYMCIILCVISLIVAATLFHLTYLKKKASTLNSMALRTLLVFSIISNVKKIVTVSKGDGTRLEFISGMKFISMLFILAGHSAIFIASSSIHNRKCWMSMIKRVTSAFFLNSMLLVDTFLLMSGFLCCYLLLREFERKKSVNFLLLNVVRYIRLTPSYLIVIGLYATWLPKLDVGPLWYRMHLENERCLASWWTNILYVNNYVNTDNLCMFQSWYLSVDTQLFIIIPIVVIYPLWRWPRLGHCILFCITAISILVPFLVTIVDNVDPTLMIYIRELKDISANVYFKSNYIKTHMRAQSYIFGVICGYALHRIQTFKYQLSENIVKLGWIFGLLSSFISMYSVSVFYTSRQYFNNVEAAFYAAFHRVGWNIGVGWIIIACATNNSGPVRGFLENKIFVVLSKLTYTAYLLNGLVVLHSWSTVQSPQYMSVVTLSYTVMAQCMTTFAAALLLTLMFESPILGLERLYLRRERTKPETKTTKNTGETNA